MATEGGVNGSRERLGREREGEIRVWEGGENEHTGERRG